MVNAMTQIYLIRHGQASFGAENYDQLSEIGREQARHLGCYFKSIGMQFDRIVHGSLSRQTETAEILAASKDHRLKLVCDARANEFLSEQVVDHYLPIVADRSEKLRQQIEGDSPWYLNPQCFEMIFRALISAWQLDEHCPFESFQAFQARVLELLNDLRNEHGFSKKNIALVTSGGVISTCVQSILKSDDDTFVDMNLAINNSSYSQIMVRKQFIETQNAPVITTNLLGFNNISAFKLAKQPHLITRI